MYLSAKEARQMRFDSGFFDVGLDRMGTASVKWGLPGVFEQGMIPLWVADMDFRGCPAVTEALEKRAKHPCYGYTMITGEDRRAFCSWWQSRHGVLVEPMQIAFLPSVVSGLRVCVQEYSKPGDGVIIQTPVYGPFFASIEEAGRRVLEAPLTRGADGRFAMDLSAVEEHLKAGARLMILCNPHNPVGRAWTREELAGLTALLSAYGCALVSDEIHADFVYAPAEFTSMLAMDWEPATVLTSASKTFNLAGLQHANIVCRDPKRLNALELRLHRAGVECGNLMALAATKAAYEQGADWLDGLLDYLNQNRAFLAARLAELLPEAVVTPSEATYLAWVDISALGFSNAEAYRRCRDAGVIPTDGTAFGKTAGEGFMRLNYGCPRSQLNEGLKRFAAALKGE